MPTQSPTFCPWPWVGWSSQTDGCIRVCPYSQASSSSGVCTDDEGHPLRADQAGVIQSRNNPVLKRLRARMLQGLKTPEICGRCYNEEAYGLVSRRQIENQRGLISGAEVTANTDESGTIAAQNVPLKLFDLRLGNHCNLSCRMCSPGSSNKLYRENFHFRRTRFRVGSSAYELKMEPSGVVTVDSKNFEWYQNSDLFDYLFDHADDIVELHFSGGEPLLIKEHHRLLERLSELPQASKISITYNTNLTTLPEKIVLFWEKFKAVQVAISMDAMGDANNYIRHPSTFEEIEKNIWRLDLTSPHISYWINSTVQLMNSFAIFDLWKWILASDLRKLNHWTGSTDPRHLFISHTRLNHPRSFTIEVLPPRLKERWYRKGGEFLEWLASEMERRFGTDSDGKQIYDRTAAVVNGYRKIMEKEDRSHLIEEFLRTIEAGDQFRNQNFQAVFPDLHKGLAGALPKK